MEHGGTVEYGGGCLRERWSAHRGPSKAGRSAQRRVSAVVPGEIHGGDGADQKSGGSNRKGSVTNEKIALIGVGFMGGSLARALKKKFPGVTVAGFARNSRSRQKLQRLGLVDKVSSDLEEVVREADYVVLSLPVYVITEYMQKISKVLKAGCVVFDLGSTKQYIHSQAKRRLPRKVKFIGCHPLCGSEKSGAEFSREDLYRGSVCIMTSSPRSSGTRQVKKMWNQLGATVVFLTPAKHDRLLSSLSHLPHVISFCLTSCTPLTYAVQFPKSLKELTRISGSPPQVWAEIFLSNKNFLLQDIRKFREELDRAAQLISRGRQEELGKWIRKANSRHAAIQQG
ncbi:MAG: prephenate dehydrogenase/arogenate dehydrogenase family protein [Candidatus Omnitrophica bacterium]|nr:prephenate dehydrogenase/arogenate dehydrogenase family protein [Candidatus Omnitrophota bacterium]